MSELPYMPVVVNDAIAEAASLSNEELGALWRIKWALWKAGGYLPDDQKKLARIAGAGKRWGKIAGSVLSHLTILGGQVSSSEVLHTLLITRERRASKSTAANIRWSKTGVRSATSDGPLNSRKSLISNETDYADASLVHMQSKSESKNKDVKLLRTGAAAGRTAGLSTQASSGSNEALETETLRVHGIELLIDRCPRLTRLQAERQMSLWLGRVEPSELARALAEADVHNLRDDPFTRVIDKAVANVEAQSLFGGSLALGPSLAAKRSKHG